MNSSRLLSMTKKDVVLTTRQGFFLFMVVMPVVLTIVLNAALGSVGETTPSLVVYGDNEIISILEEKPTIRVYTGLSEEEIREAVLNGEYDAGLIIPRDSEIAQGNLPKLLISGKSLANDRLTIGSTLLSAYREGVQAGEVNFKSQSSSQRFHHRLRGLGIWKGQSLQIDRYLSHQADRLNALFLGDSQ